MKTALSRITAELLNLFYPLHCAVCKRPLGAHETSGVCVFCRRSIPKNLRPYCKSCGRGIDTTEASCSECAHHPFSFERAYAACVYEGAAKELIHQFKYTRKTHLSEVLGQCMVEFVHDNNEVITGVDLVTYVPLERRRLHQRGFNQSRLLARTLGRACAIPLADLLEKTRQTRPQNELPRHDRLTNVKHAFRIKNHAPCRGQSVLIVDDVMTTGATLSECARALLDGGASRVRCLALARPR